MAETLPGTDPPRLLFKAEGHTGCWINTSLSWRPCSSTNSLGCRELSNEERESRAELVLVTWCGHPKDAPTSRCWYKTSGPFLDALGSPFSLHQDKTKLQDRKLRKRRRWVHFSPLYSDFWDKDEAMMRPWLCSLGGSRLDLPLAQGQFRQDLTLTLKKP